MIGGSMALALRKKMPAIHLIGYDHRKVLKRAQQMKLIHQGTEDLRTALSRADLVIIATPIKVILELLPQIAQYADVNAIITDVESVKGVIMKEAKRWLLSFPRSAVGTVSTRSVP